LGAKSILCFLSLAAMGIGVGGGDRWPQFRGPLGNGHADAPDVPLTWSETNHVVWKTAVHGSGWSSPVVWDGQVWVTTADEDGRQMFAVCADLSSGRIVHDIRVFETENPEHVASVNSYASPTPVVAAGRLFVHYGTYGTACLDTRDGRILWARRDLRCDHHEGPGSSPILHDNLLVFHVDGRDVQYVAALDASTGRTVWKTPRSVDFSQVRENCRKAFCTPVVLEAAGRLQMLSPGAKAVMAYDPRTGLELWKIRYDGWSVTPRPVHDGRHAFVITDYDRPQLWAVRLDGEGDVTGSHVAWKRDRDMPATASLLLIDGLLYMANHQGDALCIEASTGEILWRGRLGGKHSASPVYAAGRIYFLSEKGVCTVIAPGRQFRVLAENRIEGRWMATPAVAGQSFLMRSQSHLYRIE